MGRDSLTFLPAYHPEFSWLVCLGGLTGLVAGIIVFRRSKTWPTASIGVGLALVGIAAAWFVGLSLLLRLRLAYGKPMPVAVGLVHNYRPEPPEGHQSGSFTVNDVAFTFSARMLSTGARRFPGLRDGMMVRVHYMPDLEGHAIAALDTASHAP